MKILITGTSGRTGPTVVSLLARNYEIRAMDLHHPPGLAADEFLFGDVTHPLDARRAVDGVEAIVHMGGRSGNHPIDPDNVLRVNIMGTYNILEAAREAGIRKIVYTSTECALGYAQARFRPRQDFPIRYLPIDEEHPDSPTSEYGLSKLLAERLCRGYSEGCGIQTFCLRLCLVVNPDGYALHDLHHPTPEAWDNMWTVLDARDMAEAIRLCLANESLKHEVLYIHSGVSATHIPTEELIHRFFPQVTQISPDLVGNAPLISIAKAQRLLGFHPQHPWSPPGQGIKP